MAESTNYVIQYIADLSNVKKQLSELDKINRTTSANMGKNFSKAVDILDRRIKSIRSKPVFDKDLGRNVIKTFAEVETVFRATDGSLKTLTRSTVLSNGKLKTLNSTVKNGASVTRSFGDNLRTLVKRAAITIPVWFALRSAVFGFFRTIKEGLTNLATFDQALQKLRRNVSATSTDIESDFSTIQQRIEEFSLKSGKSVEDVTDAIQKFATVGFDVETSLKGGLDATKLSVTLFGDASETANAFARSLRVLTEDFTDPIKKQKAIAEALALTDQLWKTNAFEINEFSGNLEKFAGTAKIANLSISDTLSLLATLSTGGLGSRAGRLLRSTLLRSLADIKNVTKTLKLDFDPYNQPTIVFIQELVKSLKGLSVTKNVPVELASTLGELFSVRSTEALAALTALEKTLQSNLALKPDVAKFNKEFEDQNEQINRLVERYKNLNKEMGKAFVTGLLGAGNYQSVLKSLVGTQEGLIGGTERLGQVIRNAFLVTGVASLIVFRKQLISTLALLGKTSVLGAVAGFIVLNFAEEAKRLGDEAQQASKDFNKLGQDVALEINKGFRGKLSLEELDNLINKIEVFGGQGLGFDQSTLDRTLTVLKEIRVEEEKITVEKTKQELSNKKRLQIPEKTKQEDQNKKQELSNKKRLQIAEIVLNSELEFLKIQGARNSQIIETEQLLRKQLNIEKTVLDQLKDQVTLEREINEERRLRSELGNESIKLFRIAQQQEGTGIAEQIGGVLSGEIDFSNFVRRGGEALDIFKKQFANIFEQQQALAFFKGDVVPDLQGLRGGRRIDIQEEAIRTPVPSFSVRAGVQQRELVRALSNLKVQEQTVIADRVVLSSPAGGSVGTGTLTTQNLPSSLSGVSKEIRNKLTETVSIFPAGKELQFAITIDIAGQENIIVGTKENVARIIADLATPQIRKVIIDNITNNSQSDESKAIDSRINNF